MPREFRMAKAGLTKGTEDTAVMKDIDDFKRDAERVYEDARDQGKMLATLAIAQALVTAYYSGGQDVLQCQLEHKTSPAVVDLTGDPPFAADDLQRGGGQ